MVSQQWTSDCQAVVLLSGGRDSMLAAALAVEQGYYVRPVIFDNGHIAGIDRAEFAVTCLRQVYGVDHVAWLEVRKCGMHLTTTLQKFWQTGVHELSDSYPDLQAYQVHCLACKSVMYSKVIEYCRSLGVATIVDGVRRCQGFYVDHQDMVDKYREFCTDAGIELLTPVYELVSDMERKRLLDDRGLPTKTLEPQCYLGCPLSGELNCEQLGSLSLFFERELEPLLFKKGG